MNLKNFYNISNNDKDASAERIPVTLVSKPEMVGNHRDFPSISQPHLHILCSHYKAWNRVFIFAFL
jgi:hypothetical protein